MGSALVVDDSPIELVMGKALLERLGHSVWTAASGTDALHLIQTHAPDLVLCDISMPGMDGIALLEAANRTENAPIFIMVSGIDDAAHAVAALERGAYGYLTKPIKADQLEKAIHDALVKHEKALQARSKVELLSKTDPVTGLPNKDEFIRELKVYVQSLQATDPSGALLFINVDGLRYINNTHGHVNGDTTLKHIAAVLRRAVRASDMVARYGGDVFAVTLNRIEPHDAETKGHSLQRAVEHARIVLGGQEHGITVTIGAAPCGPRLLVEDIVNNADFALMLARREGRNRLHIYRDEDGAHRREFGVQLNSVEKLKGVIEHNRFAMHFQPIVSLSTREARHYEALIRMRDAQGNALAPDVFIKTAEAFGLAVKIDRMVVKACIQKLAELRDRAVPVTLAINLSGLSLGDPELLALIRSEISNARIDPRRLIFEITETAAFYNLRLAQEFVRHAKDLGCQFALDDFGVGFSSFYYIKQLEIDYLKIDGSFIQNLTENPGDRVFVRAMVEISRVFGMKVIAEWVENAAIEAVLRELGVDYGQGYHFGKPEPAIPLD